MTENKSPGKVSIIFSGEKPFTLSQIGKVFTLLENIYIQFSEQVFETKNICLLLNNVQNNLGAFEIIAQTSELKSIKHSDFEELTMCVLYSIYSATFENGLEVIDKRAIAIHNIVFQLSEIIEEKQCLTMASAIDNKVVKVHIQPEKKVSLEKTTVTLPAKSLKTKTDVLKAYSENKLNAFNGANLEKFDLSNIDLSGASFIDSGLYKSNLNNTTLKQANFSDADLSKAFLNNADLSESILKSSDFSKAVMTRSNLSKADLTEADFSSANLGEAILVDSIIYGTDFSNANLTNTMFSGDIKYDNETDFSDNANWWDARIENQPFKEWLDKHYPKN